MTTRNVYHIVQHDDGWAVRLQGASSPSATAPTRAEAIEAAGEILHLLGSGRLVVHGEDGRIERGYAMDAIPTAEERRARSTRWAIAAGVLGTAFVIGLAAAIARRDA